MNTPIELLEAPRPVALDGRLVARLREVWERAGDQNLWRLCEGLDPVGMAAPIGEAQRLDAISSCLMDCFRTTGDQSAFALLFELNRRPFADAIRAKIRRDQTRVDSSDVLQEAFLNIYRYPSRFVCDRPEAFRSWGHRIVRNTLYGFLDRDRRSTPTVDDVDYHIDETERSPFVSASNSEAAELVDFAYVVYLTLYLQQYARLTDREQRALRMVEVEGASYKSTAAELGIPQTSLKMVMFRSRKKIHLGLNRMLQRLPYTGEPVCA